MPTPAPPPPAVERFYLDRAGARWGFGLLGGGMVGAGLAVLAVGGTWPATVLVGGGGVFLARAAGWLTDVYRRPTLTLEPDALVLQPAEGDARRLAWRDVEAVEQHPGHLAVVPREGEALVVGFSGVSYRQAQVLKSALMEGARARGIPTRESGSGGGR